MSRPLAHSTPAEQQGREPILSVTGISKRFQLAEKGSCSALDNVSFEVYRGEVVALLGPSGSGKSTCLRAINALETIDSGTIVVCGHDLANLGIPVHRARRHTAMIFQHFELFPHLSVLDNVRLAPRLTRGYGAREATQRALQALDHVGMGSFAAQNPRRLSGGQKQRVAIARALAVSPEILLCDEPTSALDPELVADMTELLGGIAASGMTMLVVTHEISFARRVSTRCLFLEAGRLVADAPTGDFFDAAAPSSGTMSEPARSRISAFLGKLQK